MKNKIIAVVFFVNIFVYGISVFLPLRAWASAPFLTDDPVPGDYKQWEMLLSVNMDKTAIAKNLVVPALEINWTALPNFQLHLAVPHAGYMPQDGGMRTFGPGDVEVGFKYRFIQETASRPQVGIAPSLELPTGSDNRNLGAGKLWMKLPLLIQKSWDSWTVYGAGGYVVHNADNMESYPYGGLAVQKKLNERWMVGAEVFSQGRSSENLGPFTLLNVGGTYNFTKNFSMMFSTGHSIIGDRHLVAYFGFRLVW
jgi:hypothetical protein